MANDGVPLVSAYPNPPYPDTRPLPPPNGLKGPDDGPGVRRKSRRALVALLAVVVVVAVAFAFFLATRGGNAVTDQGGLTVDMDQGRLLRPSAGQGWAVTYDRRSGTYRISGLHVGDRFTTTMVVTNAGQEPETLLGAGSPDATAAVGGLLTTYHRPGAGPGTAAPGSLALGPHDTATANLTWTVARCTDPAPATTTIKQVDVAWSTTGRTGTTRLALPYWVELVDAPTCS